MNKPHHWLVFVWSFIVVAILVTSRPLSAQASSHNLPDIMGAPMLFDGAVMRYRVSNLGQSRVRNFVQVEYVWLDANNNPVSEPCRGSSGSGLLPGLPTGSDDTWDDAGGSEVISLEPWQMSGRCPFSIPSSASRLRVKLDATNANRESNETNNTFYFARPLPDLVLEPIDLDLVEGRLRFRARNRGTGVVNIVAPLEIRWVDENNTPRTEPCQSSLNSLPILPTGSDDNWDEPGGASIVTVEDWHYRNSCPFGVLLGSWRKIRIVVDPDNRIAESNNENNTIYFQRPLPDLSVSGASFSSRTHLAFTIQQGEVLKRGDVDVKFEWIHRNGTTRLGDSYTMEVDDLGERGERATRVDSDGFSGLKSFISRPPDQARFLNIIVDPTDDVNEIDDNNNVREVARPLPDLVIENVRWNGTNVSFTVRNNTDVPIREALAMSKIRFEWHTGTGALANVFYDINIPDYVLRANGAMNFGPYVAGSAVNTWFVNRPANATALWIMVDPLESLLEQSRSNNRAILAR